MFRQAVLLCLLWVPATAQDFLSPRNFEEQWTREVPTAGSTVLGISYSGPDENTGELYAYAAGTGGGRLCVRLRSQDGRYRGLAEFDWPTTPGWRKLRLASRYRVIGSLKSGALPSVAWRADSCGPGALGRTDLRAIPLRWGRGAPAEALYFHLNTSQASVAKVRVKQKGVAHETECQRTDLSTVYDRVCEVRAGRGSTEFLLVTEFLNDRKVAAVDMELP